MISRYEQFSFLISGIYRSIQKIEREEMIKYGYKGAYAQYLMVMKRHPEGITAAQLGEESEKDKAAVSRAVADMLEKGLLRREADGDTMYRARLYLTQAGMEAAQFVSHRAAEAVSAVGLTGEERESFYRVLDMISGNLQEISVKGIPRAHMAKADIGE